MDFGPHRPGDSIRLLHIPRTGATTLLELLGQRGADVSGSEDEHDGSVARRRMPRLVTMLREPVSRLMSRQAALRQMPQHPLSLAASLPLRDFLRHPDVALVEANRQTRMLAGATDATGGAMPDDATLFGMAKECLADLTFFGLRERFGESARLLAHTFGWQPFDAVPVRNATHAMNHRLRLSVADLEAAQEITMLDAALFRFARRLFLGRLTSLEPVRKAVVADRGV